MSKFHTRRSRNIVLFIICIAVLMTVDALVSLSLHRTTVVTGWLLLVSVIGLAAYNVRKKLPFLPWGSSATWLQLHIYVGLFTIALFGEHIHWRVPNGILESTLSVIYVLVVASGIFGLAISRLFARRLTARGGEVIFEQIPRLRNRIRKEVEQLVSRSLEETQSTAIAEFYVDRLQPFFGRSQDFLAHLTHSSQSRRALLTELDWQGRYLNESGRECMGQIAERVRAKDDLDYHHAHQATLKYWLFVHLPLTYALLAFALAHVVLVYAFSGGMR